MSEQLLEDMRQVLLKMITQLDNVTTMAKENKDDMKINRRAIFKLQDVKVIK